MKEIDQQFKFNLLDTYFMEENFKGRKSSSL